MSKRDDDINLTARETFPLWTPVTIRYSDQDEMGHVNNVALAAYIEAARTMFLKDLMDRFPSPAVDFVLARVAIDYHHEIFYPGTVEVGARVVRAGTKSLVTGYGVFFQDRCIATAQCVNVCFDMAARASTPLPNAMRHDIVAQIDH
jgi:acyl-CoA thioester hydrolase